MARKKRKSSSDLAGFAVILFVILVLLAGSGNDAAAHPTAFWSEKQASARQPTCTCAPAATATPMTAPAQKDARHLEESILEVHFLNVGDGDAAILLCDGHAMMIDGGPPNRSDLIYAYLVHTLHLTHLDCVILTHPHDDHVGGLSAAFNACTVGALYSPVTAYESRPFASLVKYAGRQGVPVTVPEAGQRIALGTADVTFLTAGGAFEKINDDSLVIRVTQGETSFLFTGDIEREAESAIAKMAHRSTVLKVAHHGSDTSSTQVFLEAVAPEYAVISVGPGTRYGHPDEDVVERILLMGAQLYRTDLHGNTVIATDGKEITVRSQKAPATSKPSADTAMLPLRTTMPPFASAPYIGNANTGKFHHASCDSVGDMQEWNKVPLYSREDAVRKGYIPCKRCDP